jgi:nucleotide-binding universal stress UspA family protein
VPTLVVRAADGLRPVQRLSLRHPLVVVPLDGSKFGEAALPVAAGFAHALDGRVLLIAVVVPPAPPPVTTPFAVDARYIDVDTTELETATRHYLDRVVASYPPIS